MPNCLQVLVPFTEPFCTADLPSCTLCSLLQLFPQPGHFYLEGHGQLFFCQHLIPAKHKGTFLPHHLQLAQEVPLL